jgi:excisionase family DNA binding protein
LQTIANTLYINGKFYIMEKLLTAKQVQDLLNVDRTTIYRMLKDGRLVGVKVGQHWRFSSQEVEALLSGSPNNGESKAPEINVGVLPLHCMQPVQDVFAEISGIGSVLTDKDGQPLTKISNSCDFCKLILGSDDGRKACIESWRKMAEHEGPVSGFTACHAGLQYSSAHIEIHGEFVAMLVAGQFFAENPDPQELAENIRALAERYDISPELLAQAAERISVLDGRKDQLGEWLQRVATTFQQIGSERADFMHRLKQISAMSDITH